MRSIFRYPGGKTRSGIQEWIKSHRPGGCREYREPFVGGGGVFFCMDGFERYWLNDLHQGLTEVYRALVERPDDFISKCKAIEPAREDDELTEPGPRGGKRLNKRLKAIFDEFAFGKTCNDEALRYFFINRTVFGGRVNYDIPSRLHFSNPEGWNIVKTNQLELAKEKLSGCKVTRGDYSSLFDEPGEGVWIYADPPYMVNTEMSRTSQLYQHGFTYEDHRKFAGVVSRCKHRVCISYDDDPSGEIRKLFEGWCHIKDGRWTYCGTTNGKGGKETGHELLIFHNYIPNTIEDRAICSTEADEGDLTEAELTRLEELEERMERKFTSFVELGECLEAIRDGKLWRPDGNFPRYLQRRWPKDLSETRAGQLINAARLLRQIESCNLLQDNPSRELHVQQLIRVKSEDGQPDPVRAAEVWNRAVQEHGIKRITAKLLREAVDTELGVSRPSPSFVETFRRRWPLLSDDERAVIRGIVYADYPQQGKEEARCAG